ncbi:MAG: SdpI family protein [Pseudomonadota bacterium]
MMLNRWAVSIIGTVFLAMFAASAIGFALVPGGASIPVHYDINGVADRFAGPMEAFLMLPACGAFVMIVTVIAVRAEPRKANLERGRTVLSATITAAMLLLGAIHVATVATALGYEVDIPALVTLGVALIFVITGNLMPKTRPNFTVGVRTRWTLESERSWRLTHLWAGRAFVALGIATLAASLIAPKVAMLVIILGTLGLTAAAMYLSWHWWRSDPARAQ